MRVLLAVTCLLAVVSGLTPGAKRGTFLNQIQVNMTMIYDSIFPNGKLNNGIYLGILTAKNDLCKITSEDVEQQQATSVIVGKKCKKAFVKLYSQEDQCSGVFCNVLSNAQTFLNETMRDLITAEFDKDFFNIIETRFVDPAMEYSCKCLVRMLDAWLGCKDKIGDADIWYTLMGFGGFDTKAAYLGGKDWKDYWVDVLANRLPWDDIKVFVERTVTNLCQRNTDVKGQQQCYSYFYKTFTTLYQWYQKSAGLTQAVNKKDRNRVSDELEHCTTYNFSRFVGRDVSFGEIKDAVVDKFCVEECSDMYQKTFLGCCTASMIQDRALEEAVTNTAEGISDIYAAVFPEEGEETSSVFKSASEYFEDTMDMLRNPECPETGVTYNVDPCDGAGSIGADECAGLTGKQMKICKRKAKKNKGGSDDDQCEGLSGKQLRKCKKKAKDNNGGSGDADDQCKGLSGKQLKICKRKAKKNRQEA